MKIAIVGAGSVGTALGTGWAQKGHRVIFGSRHPESPDVQKTVQQAGNSASAATNEEAAAKADVVVLSVPWPAAREAVQSLGDLGKKVVIDAVNPLLPDLSALAVGTTTSAGEQIAGWAKGGRFVKGFNTVGSSIMENSDFGSGKPVLFYCGDDQDAKRTVHQLADDLGFDPRDAGPLTQARLLEPFALLWVSLAFGQKWGREFAFQVLKR